MTIQRGGLTLQASRSYYSKGDWDDLGIGPKWDHSLLAHIKDLAGDGAILHKGGGSVRIRLEGGEYQTNGPFKVEKVSGRFELTQPNGFKFYFDGNHNIVSKVSPQGPYYNWLYDGNQNVTTIQYQGTTDVVYADWDHTNHRLTKLTDVQGGATVIYLYSDAGDLTKVTGSCGSCSGTAPAGYQYDTASNMTALYNVADELLHDNQYDSAGRVTKQVYQVSPERSYVYDYSEFSNGILKVTKPDGVANEYHMDSQNQGTKVVVKNNGIQGSDIVVDQYFDASGQLTRHVHGNGFDRRFYHDANGRMTMAVRYDAVSPLTVSQYEYNAKGQQTRYIDAEGIVTAYHYDDAGSGRLTQKVVDPGGLALAESWVYDPTSGLAITHSAPGGRVTAFAHDSNGYVTREVVDPGGLALVTHYQVDAAGRVTKRIDPRGHEWVQLYNTTGKVTRQVDPDGRTMLYAYDGDSRLITQTVQDAPSSPTITQTTTYHYDRYGNLTRQAEPGNRHTDYAYDFLERRISMQLPTGEQFAYDYNELGEIHQEKVYDGTNWITQATYLYDGDKQLTRQTDALGHAVIAGRFYDSYNRVTRETGPLGHYSVFEYDGMDRNTRQVFHDIGNTERSETRLAYDAGGRLTSQRVLATPGGSLSNADQLVEMAYDDAGQLLTQTRYLAGVTTALQVLDYDAAGRTTRQSQSDGPTIEMTYDAAGNLLTRVIDPSGLALANTYFYNEVNRLTRTVQSDGIYQIAHYDGLRRLRLQVQYDNAGIAFAAVGQMYDNTLNLITKTFQVNDPASGLTYNFATDPTRVMLYSNAGKLTAYQDPNGNTTSFAYDALGRHVTVTDPMGNQQIMVYDHGGQIITQLQRDYDGAGYTIFETAFEYDAAHRQTRVIQQGPDGDFSSTGDNQIITLWYDAQGEITQQEDPSGVRVASYYDAFGNVTRQVESVQVGGIGRITDGAYDRSGRLTRLTAYTDSVSGTGIQHTDYLYSRVGVLTRATYPDDTAHGGPDRGFVEFFYDTALRLTRQVDQNALATDAVYDAMGRQLTLTRGVEVDSFTYMPWGAIASAQRGTSGNPDVVSHVSRVYDGLMRLTRESQSIQEDAARHVDYAYDLAGNVLTLGYPGGTTVTTSFDALNRRDAVAKNASPVATYSYAGQRVQSLIYETGANDVTQSHHYDGAMRLTRLSQMRNSVDLASFNYAFDATDNITNKVFTHRLGSPSESYGYDTLHRLTHTMFGQRTGTPYEGFVYDDLGNHLTQDHNGTAIAGLFNGVNEQTKRDGTDVLWDQTGNLTKDDVGQQYFYDRQNMLTRVEDDGNNLVESYQYDALGRRIVADDGTSQKRFYWTGQQMIEEANGSNVVQRTYVWGDYIDELLVFEDTAGVGGSSGAHYYALRHHNFNVVALADSSGTIVERYDYNPYGKRFVLKPDFSDDSDGVSNYGNSIGHQGLYHDTATSLIHNRARMLHTSLRRFIQRDLLEYVDGMGLYEYVRSMPLTFKDPAGTRIWIMSGTFTNNSKDQCAIVWSDSNGPWGGYNLVEPGQSADEGRDPVDWIYYDGNWWKLPAVAKSQKAQINDKPFVSEIDGTVRYMPFIQKTGGGYMDGAFAYFYREPLTPGPRKLSFRKKSNKPLWRPGLKFKPSVDLCRQYCECNLKSESASQRKDCDDLNTCINRCRR